MFYISDANEYLRRMNSPLSVILTFKDDNNYIPSICEAVYEDIACLMQCHEKDDRNYWAEANRILDILLNYKDSLDISLHILDAHYNIFLLYLYLLCDDEVMSTDIIELVNSIYYKDTDNIVKLSAFLSNGKELAKVNALIAGELSNSRYSGIQKLLKGKLYDGKSVEYAISNLHAHNVYDTNTHHYLQVLNEDNRMDDKKYVYIGDKMEDIHEVIDKYSNGNLSLSLASDNHNINTSIQFFSNLTASMYDSIYNNRFVPLLMGETFYKYWQLVDTTKVMMIDISYMLKIQNALMMSRKK